MGNPSISRCAERMRGEKCRHSPQAVVKTGRLKTIPLSRDISSAFRACQMPYTLKNLRIFQKQRLHDYCTTVTQAASQIAPVLMENEN